MLANAATFSSANKTTHIHFSTWFRKWKIGGTEANLHIFTEHFLHEKIKCLLQIGKAHVFIYVQSFDLVKEAVRSCADRFIPVHTTRTDNANRQFSFLHLPYLNIACVRAQKPVG